MQPYEKHLEKHIERLAKKYADGIQKVGLKRSKTLEKAISERTLREAKESYIQEVTETRDRNIAAILSNHHEEMNDIKKRGLRLRLKTCSPIALVFGLVAGYNFGRPSDGWQFGILYSIFALAFLAMLVFGAIFDRPTKF